MRPANNGITYNRSTPAHCLLYWTQKKPDAVFFTQPLADGSVVEYTWKQVADQVLRMAAHLQSLGLPARSHIGIFGKNSAHWIMADLAIWMAGYVTIPLYPTLNAETAEYVLEHGEAKVLFIGKLDGKSDSWNQVKEVIPADMPCITLPLSPVFKGKSWQDIVRDTPALVNPVMPHPDDMASVIYTSGSTGKPKGVMHSFSTMLQVAQNMEKQFGLGNNERMLSYLPLAHALERVLVETSSLYLGGHIFFADNLQTFIADLGRARPTVFVSVPRLWTKFQHGINDKIPPHIQKILFRLPVVNRLVRNRILKQLGLSETRLAITGSAPLPAAVLSWYRQLGLELLEGYGMTENFGYSHVNRPGLVKVGTVGMPQVGVECRIAEDGEVQVKSPGTMLGYYKAPDKTAEVMTDDGFLKTGDVGEVDSMERLKLTGRIKDIFKTSKGKYVAPVPIELKLAESPLIEMVCVGGSALPQPIGLLMLDEQAFHHGRQRADIQTELEQLLKQINQGLEAHEKLDFLVVVKDPWNMENGLLTPTMKIRRQQIEDHYCPHFDAWEKQERKVIWV